MQKLDSNFLRKYGPWAVVTGASSGIGKAIAVELANSGFKLILVGRDLSRLQNITRDFGKTVEVIPVVADLSIETENERLIDISMRYNVGLLVLCAGYGTSGPIYHTSKDSELGMAKLNMLSSLHLTHHFANRFVGLGKGGIVLMSSIVSFQGVPRASNYAATKAYIQTLSEGLALELKGTNVDLIAGAPGPVKSGFEKRANMRLQNAIEPKLVATEILNSLGKKMTVYPGIFSKFARVGLGMLPRTIRTAIMGKIMKGFTAHQR
ncbi:SDR family NAD(P)-dependent oxidoreductase [Phaeocystidibacter luteus]|uniref:NADP-dependent 3-hydroxy acid dehydrogenase YdfG n=1 Tax=Phaeocystidibacter luteus TaxID=911197 RepID=A0A6N6RHU9_9FLAO|nr:SDR family NAD(P)-dependent oxidoreductase [Phaeocystidibacter luteus]KAB2809914.1 SDR family NAD(P)-dependent oxidoreductase [Phaeocystidibacter luteus]